MKIRRKLIAVVLSVMVALACLAPIAGAADKVNINTASVAELTDLKFVGEKLAEKIVEYREAQPFETPEDIKKVKGIGDKVFEENKDRIIVKDE